MRPVLKRTLRYIPIFLVLAQAITTQGQFTGFGSKSAGSKQQSNDQKAGKLLHDKLPLVLDANTAYPTVPDQDMLGGPFRPRTLPVTLGSLTKPLPPGDYVLPMTFFCSEYSVHRGGNGIAYQLGPAQGTAAKAISTLLWRGMLTGHKPQELQSVSWAIQGSVAYDKMPPKYKALVDQLIPEMKNQVNGQAFADIEDGFQGKVNRVTKKISEGISKGTGGFVHADIKVDVELNESFERLGQVGRSALDGEKLNTIFTKAFPSDQAREQALYAGQGQQTAALPAANGPWSIKVPGLAYMRFVVHGGNLQGDNMMQIRILPPRASQALVNERPHLVLAEYEQTQQSSSSSPSVISLFNGSVNETALSQCQAIPVNQQMCMAQAITVSGDTGYSIGTGAQAPIMAPSSPITTQNGQLRILRAGVDITGTTQTVLAGQPIKLNAQNAAARITSSQWTVEGDTVGSYSISTEAGSAPKPDFSRLESDYYWVASGKNLSVTVESLLDNGATESATAHFDVSKPEGVSVTPEIDTVAILPNPCNSPKGVWVMLGVPCNPLSGGMTLNYQGDSSLSGSYLWFQFILKDIDSLPGVPGRKCVADGGVPYGGSRVNWALRDSPGQPLTDGFDRPEGLTERSRDFAVRTYLMWRPDVQGSIPVSLGFIEWGYTSDAIRKGGPVVLGRWKLQNSTTSGGQFISSSVLPQWATLRKSTGTQYAPVWRGKPMEGTIQGTCPP